MSVSGIIFAIAGGSVGVSLLLARGLGRIDRCCSCGRRCELAVGTQTVQASGRLICSACTRTIEPRRPL